MLGELNTTTVFQKNSIRGIQQKLEDYYGEEIQ